MISGRALIEIHVKSQHRKQPELNQTQCAAIQYGEYSEALEIKMFSTA